MSGPHRVAMADLVPPSPPLCAIVASAAEAHAIVEERSFAWRQINDRVWDSDRFDLRLAISGAGKALASWCFARYAAEASRILSIGVSGALGDEEVGSIWICDEFVEHDFDLTALGVEAGITPSESMSDAVFRSAGREFVELALRACTAARIEASTCRSASGDLFLADPRVGRAVAARTGARLFDLESAALAKLAVLRAGTELGAVRRFRPDLLALRYVADNASHLAEDSRLDEMRKASIDFADVLLELVKEEEASRPGA